MNGKFKYFIILMSMFMSMFMCMSIVHVHVHVLVQAFINSGCMEAYLKNLTAKLDWLGSNGSGVYFCGFCLSKILLYFHIYVSMYVSQSQA